MYQRLKHGVKMWNQGVPMDVSVIDQVSKLARLPIIHSHVAVMPDAHVGIGSTIGSVFPTVGAIIPSAVGVDIGCGMCAVKTSLTANQLPQGKELSKLRSKIEELVPHGRTSSGKAKHDVGAWEKRNIPSIAIQHWEQELEQTYKKLCHLHPSLSKANALVHLGTLGTGNHFLELCLDENDDVWCMLHSGSRGIGNKIGTYFISQAKKEMSKLGLHVEDADLSYLKEGTQHFNDYVLAVGWAQKFASVNRKIMMYHFLQALQNFPSIPAFDSRLEAVDCHHNYVQLEDHFGKQVFLTRKGAISAKKGQLGIIPGSMGAKSYIVRGLGNPESFHSCSHGAGRVMSRNQAKKQVSMDEHLKAISNVECKKDSSIIDETPSAYKDIDAVMKAQSDLVEVVHTLRQVLCVKG